MIGRHVLNRFSTRSYGILENKMPYANTPTISTSSPTSCGWMIKSSLSPRGASPSAAAPYSIPVARSSCSFSGDGTLSVMDVRSKKMEPVAQSEDQEDELLSILPIKRYVRQDTTPPVTNARGMTYPVQWTKGRRWDPVGHPLRVQPQKWLGRLC